MPVTFTLSDKQDLEIARWQRKHLEECKVYKHKLDHIGCLTYRFTPFGKNLITTVECVCGQRMDASGIK